MTREEAIKVIKSATVYTPEEMKALETLIPELRESEDERIRKDIIKYLKTVNEVESDCNHSVINEWLAWLEKQKEQNDDAEEYTDFTIYHPLKNGKGEYECIPYSFYGSLTSFSEDKDLVDFLRTCFYTKEECEEWIQKQKEQKPVLSPEKKEYVRQLKALVSYFVRDKKPKDVEFYQRIWNWLDGLNGELIPID